MALLSGVAFIVSGCQLKMLGVIQVNKSPYDVINYVSDLRNELQWNPNIQFVEKKSAGPIGIGTVFSAKWRKSDTLDVTIQQYYPPYSVTFENGGPLHVTRVLQLSKIGEQTQLESSVAATPHGFRRILFPVLKSRLKAREKERMINLKKGLDSNG